MKAPRSDDLMIPPDGARPSVDASRVRVTEIPMGPENITTCDIALGDLDGDGLEEIATVLTAGEDDSVRAYRGTGELLWENTDVRLYHAFYGDRERSRVPHMWYRIRHRHVLTKALDWDGDGSPEVLVGDGPVYVLDGETGRTLQTIDLKGSVPLWTVAVDESSGPLLIATVDRKAEGGHLVAVRPDGSTAWSQPLPGQAFCDCMLAGALGPEGRTVVGFSIEDVRLFRIVDLAGKTWWELNVREDLGEDDHVDDFIFAPVLPETKENQIASGTGPALIGGDGKVLWSLRDLIDHGQAARAGNFLPDVPGMQLFFVDSLVGRTYLTSAFGQVLWTYQNYSRVRPDLKDKALHRLSNKVDVIHWSAPDRDEIVLGEIVRLREDRLPEGLMTLYVTVLDGEGRVVDRLPFQDAPGPGALGFVGDMTVTGAHVTDGATDDIVVVTHNSSTMFIYSRV